MYTVFLAGKSPYIRSYTVYIYGSGQPYTYVGLVKTVYGIPFTEVYTAYIPAPYKTGSCRSTGKPL